MALFSYRRPIHRCFGSQCPQRSSRLRAYQKIKYPSRDDQKAEAKQE